MLNTGAWRINVTGPTGLAARLVGPYLELIDAFDIMAGDRHVAPEEVRFYSRSDVAWYRRTAVCVYELVDGSDRADEPYDTCPEVEIRIPPRRPRRARTVLRPLRDRPRCAGRLSASSITWDLTASVNWLTSLWACSSSQLRSMARRPGRAAKAASAASLTVRRVPMTVDTSTLCLRAASAWVVSREVTSKKISHFASGDGTRGHRRAPFSLTDNSSQVRPRACQSWFNARHHLRVELRRRTTVRSGRSKDLEIIVLRLWVPKNMGARADQA